MTGRKTVLVVDDDPGILHVLANGLANVLDMFDVVTANHGQEAVEILERQHVDVIVTDLVMPIMDGFALIAYLTNRGVTLPVVVLSGMAAHAMEARLSGYAGLRILRKPAGYQAVARCVLEEIERAERGQLQGIPLAGILQLLEAERRSCTVLVRSGKRRGRLHFESGTLLNAFSDDFGAEGEAAAFDILGWSDTAVEFAPLPAHVRRLVHTPLQLMLLDLAAMQDRTQPVPHDDLATAAGGAPDAGTPVAAPAPSDAPAASQGVPPPATEPASDEPAVVVDHVVEPVVEPVPEPVAGLAVAEAAETTATEAAPEAPPASAPSKEDASPAPPPPAAAGDADAADTDTADTDTADEPDAHAVPPADGDAADEDAAELLAAIERLAGRAREAEAALGAVAAEVEAFQAARRRFDAIQARRERQRRELETFRDDVARLAREILGRVDGLFDAMAPEESGGPADPTPPAS